MPRPRTTRPAALKPSVRACRSRERQARDSDIFVVNVDDLISGAEQPTNITNSPTKIDDDADWSLDGQKLVFTKRDVTDPTKPTRSRQRSMR